MKYKRIEKKLDTIIQLLETIVSRLPRQVAKEEPAADNAALVKAELREVAPQEPVPSAATPKTARDPLALIENREEWLRVVEGWKEPAGISHSRK